LRKSFYHGGFARTLAETRRRGGRGEEEEGRGGRLPRLSRRRGPQTEGLKEDAEEEGRGGRGESWEFICPFKFPILARK